MAKIHWLQDWLQVQRVLEIKKPGHVPGAFNTLSSDCSIIIIADPQAP
jgi:hypothetical protein